MIACLSASRDRSQPISSILGPDRRHQGLSGTIDGRQTQESETSSHGLPFPERTANHIIYSKTRGLAVDSLF